MDQPTQLHRLDNARELLHGYPPGTIETAEQFLRDGQPAALDRLVDLILAHHLPARPDSAVIASLPATAQLVGDVGLDSFAIVELTFLLEELLGVKFPDEELRRLQTLGDFRTAIRARARRI